MIIPLCDLYAALYGHCLQEYLTPSCIDLICTVKFDLHVALYGHCPHGYLNCHIHNEGPEETFQCILPHGRGEHPHIPEPKHQQDLEQ